MGVLSAAPTDPEEQYAQQIAALERRLADLERAFGRFPGGAGAPAGTGNNSQWYYDTTNDRLYVSDGSGWIVMFEPPQSYTVTTTNVTLGTGGSALGSFQRNGGRCDFYARIVLGTGGSFTGQVTMSLPRAVEQVIRGDIPVSCIDTGVASYEGGCDAIGAGVSTAVPLVTGTGGTYAGYANINATQPFTWGSGDVLSIAGRIQMDTVYL